MANARAYHCTCTTLILATNYELESLPIRAEPALDRAKILLVEDEQGHAIFHNLVPDHKAIIIRREDGFEKRTLLRCQRCDLVIGYRLDPAQYIVTDVKPEVTYILPGALMLTDDMEAGKTPTEPEWELQQS